MYPPCGPGSVRHRTKQCIRVPRADTYDNAQTTHGFPAILRADQNRPTPNPREENFMPRVAPATALTLQAAKPRPKAESGYRINERECRCPECGDIVKPVHRRAIDRILSLFVPLHRMRCPN